MSEIRMAAVVAYPVDPVAQDAWVIGYRAGLERAAREVDASEPDSEMADAINARFHLPADAVTHWAIKTAAAVREIGQDDE